MPLHLHDTLSATRIALPQRTPGETSIYLCGPTVYNYIHVGNARPAVLFDVLVRHLRAQGQRVKYVRNFTDVDDKIINAANANNEDPRALAERFITAYRDDVSSLGCLPPDVEPRVSEHIPEIVEMVQSLIARGHAYELEGDVYFSVKSFDKYGALSKRNVDDCEAGARVDVDERKKDPMDFALWKSAKPGEPAGARWQSPWGEGRPGWHIECSAMARKHLGDGFDLHAGGIDLIFPHHENEIAQSVCATGAPFANSWMHNGFINIRNPDTGEEEKMSKSKTFFILRKLLERVDPEAVRLWLVGTHYRSPLTFEIAPGEGETPRFPGLEEAEKRAEYFYETRARVAAKAPKEAVAKGEVSKTTAEAVANMRRAFDGALDDDLNTAGALAPVSEAYKRANELCDAAKTNVAEVRALGALLSHFSSVLGVAEGDPETFFARLGKRRLADRGLRPAEIQELVDARIAARKGKDFAKADALRAELAGKGIEVRDNPTGSTWRVLG